MQSIQKMTNSNTIERNEGSSADNSMSGIYKNIMESPKPICNFYFAHPFGIPAPYYRSCRGDSRATSTPTCEFYYGSRNSRRSTCNQTTRRNSFQSSESGGTINRRNTTLVPWPRTTWKREAHLAPLLQLIAKQHGRKVPDIEKIIQSVRQAWNTPSLRSLAQSQDETEYTASFWDISCTLNYNYYQMGVGTNAPAPLMAAGPGLLKRRYSVPEIIMRKHSLAQQKLSEDSTQALATPTKAKKISVPSYYGASPPAYATNGYNGVVTNGGNSGGGGSGGSGGSDSNLSRNYQAAYNSERNVENSMRKQLLRRLLSKDVKICSRPSSLSPPSRRTTTPRRVCLDTTPSVERSQTCEECQKLGVDRNANDTSPKRVRLTQGRSLDSSNVIKTKTTEKLPPETPRKSDELRRSVLIYMTSLENGILERNQDQEVLQVEVLANQPEKEESTDSGNGEATQNLTSSSESTENAVNNNNPEDQTISNMLINNLETAEKDAENNYIEHELEPEPQPQGPEENGNEVVTAIDVFQPSSSGSFRIMSQSSNGHIQDVIVHDGSISYFPSYSLVESRGDVSSYTSQCSEPEADPIGAVQSGSAYPDLEYPYQIVVTRLSALPRTVSMEVQPSSTSAEEGIDYDSADDDSVSLVDSLDDPLSPKPRRKQIMPPRSAEAFFVPIADTPSKSLQVAEAMPDKLKERLDSRQKNRDQKREVETKKKIRKVQRVVERKVPKIEPRKVPKTRTSSSSSTPAPKPSTKPKKNVRKEIGMLESYKIDARGNMQFLNEKRQKETKKNGVIDKIEERRKQIMKDVQQMTLYQQADLTPDTEGGPRRMYQKTEIQEGDKRIEILEIVECIDTTPETSPAHYKTPRSTRTPMKTKTPRSKVESPKVPSKIPVSKPSKSFQRVRSGSSRESSPNKNPVKDKAIADLLIEALNNNDEASVEFIASMKPPTRKLVPRKSVTGKRSAHSGKYLTQFEVIPEEKSGLSFDSSTEDHSRAPSLKQTSKKSKEEPKDKKEKPRKISDTEKNSDSSRRNSDSSDKKSEATVKTKPSKKPEQDPVNHSLNIKNGNKKPEIVTEKKPVVLATKKNGLKRDESNNNQNQKNRSAFMMVADDVNGNFPKEPSPPPNSRSKATPTPKDVDYKPWNGFKHHGTNPIDNQNEDDIHRSNRPIISGHPSSVSYYFDHHHLYRPSSIVTPLARGGGDPHLMSIASSSSAASLSSLKTPSNFMTAARSSMYSLGSLMSPAAYTNAPTTSCGGGGTAIDVCQNCFPSTSDSGDCNIMRIIDQTFRDNPDIFTDEYLKRINTRDSNYSDLSDVRTAPVASTTSGIGTSTDMVLKMYDPVDEYVDLQKIEAKNLKNNEVIKVPTPVSSSCDCVQKVFTTQENAWQMFEGNDCKMIQSRIEYFESYVPENESSPAINSKALFLYKENKISTAEKKTPEPRTAEPKRSPLRSNCSSCCFCNPDLHHEEGAECAYCKSKTPLAPDTPCSIHHFYESLKKTNHTHTRIKSKDSDSISIKCTKTNEKIKRTIYPENFKLPEKPTRPLKTKSGLSRPKDINNLPKVSNVTVEKEVEIIRSPCKSSTKQRHITTKHKSEIRLPSPEKPCRSFDHTTSSSSPCSSPNCSPSKRNVTTLPPAHWQDHCYPNHTPIASSSIFNAANLANNNNLIHHPPPPPLPITSSSSKNSLCATNQKSSHQLSKASAALSNKHSNTPSPVVGMNMNRQTHDFDQNMNNNFDLPATNSHHECTSGSSSISTNNNNNNNNNSNSHSANSNVNSNNNNNNNNNVNNNHDADNEATNNCTPNIITACNTNVNNNGMVTNTAWSVTVAGNYNAEMAPDVDLRLSFPNKYGAPQTHIVPNLNSNWRKRSSANPMNKWRHPQSDSAPLSPTNSFMSKAPPALPPATEFNPKRNLIQDNKPNWRRASTHHLPGVAEREIIDQHLSRNERKGMKRFQSVASVLTATKALGMLTAQRAMSFQSLNRSNPNQRIFDQATELSRSTHRRMSVGSEAPSDMTLSVSGARITAEYKPKVPTMSEKDITRKKGNSFTRNRMQYQY